MSPSIWSFMVRADYHFNEKRSHLLVIKLRLVFTMAGVMKKSESFSLKKLTLATIVGAVMKKRAPVVEVNADAGACGAVTVNERGAESALVSCEGMVCAHQRNVAATLKSVKLVSPLKLTNDPLGKTQYWD